MVKCVYLFGIFRYFSLFVVLEVNEAKNKRILTIHRIFGLLKNALFAN